MKAKLPILLLSAALLLGGCTTDQNPGGNPGTDPDVEPSEVRVTDVQLNKSAQALTVGDKYVLIPTVLPAGATNKNVTWSTSDPSVVTVSKGVVSAVGEGAAIVTVTTVDGGKAASCGFAVSAKSGEGSGGSGGGSEGGEGGESGEDIDLDGFEDYAAAPEGEVLTDWTSDMSAILSKHLDGHVPPFFFMENMRVTYDNLGILQVRGDSTETITEDYAAMLEADGTYQYYIDSDNANRAHIYGRFMSGKDLISLDAMSANGLFTINFTIDFASDVWPAEGIADLFLEEYETRCVLPQYSYENQLYIIESDVMSNLFIYCMNAPRTSPEEYATILGEYKWQVQLMTEGEFAGMYTAKSRDNHALCVFYYDGTGLMIEVTHGEGENYTTWEDCLWAIDDFGQTELRRTDNLSELIPEPPQGETYEINRDVRGSLRITILKSTDFKLEDLFNYGIDAATGSAGKLSMKVKGDDYWLIDTNQNFCVLLKLGEYSSDTVAVTTFTMTIYDYKVYEGAIVYYGAWPTSMVDTVKNNIDRKLYIPPYVDQNAVYYVFSSYRTDLTIQIRDYAATAISDYKGIVKDNSYTVTDTATGFEAIDRSKAAKISFYIDGEFLTFKLEKYIQSTATETLASFDFTSASQLTLSQDQKTGTWTNGHVTFVVEQNTSSRTIGNGETISGGKGFLFNPLRVYKGQKITITTTAGKLEKLEFYVTGTVDGKAISECAAENLSVNTIDGCDAPTYNANTEMTRFVVTGDLASVSFVVNTNVTGSAASKSGILLTALDVFMK